MSSEQMFLVERQVYEAHKQDWSRTKQGQFVVIRGDEVVGFYNDYEEAFRAATAKFGFGVKLLIKQIYPTEPVFYIY